MRRKKIRRGYFTQRKKFYADPVLPIIKPDSDNRKDEYYARHFKELLMLIVKHISPIVNYAHFNLLLPKTDLPLRHEGAHMDISYFTSDKCICFIQFHVIRPERVSKKVLEQAWQPQN